MTTSGTATFNPDFAEIAEEAFEQAGSELRSGYDLDTARRSMNLLTLEWANKGLHLWTIASDTQALSGGTATYTMPSDTIDLLQHELRTNAGNQSTQADTTLERISYVEYAQIPNKLLRGRPTQIWIERKTGSVDATLWPVPEDDSYTLAFWYARRIEDVGTGGANTMDIPQRFLPALVAGLAYHIAKKKPDLQGRVPFLKAEYEAVLTDAMNEDRVKANWRLVPRIGRV